MKNLLSSVVCVTLASLLLGGCGSEEPSPGLVDPSDPNALSQVLVIPGAERVQGQPPQSSDAPGAPMISGGTDQEAVSGDQAVVEVTYESTTGYVDCYVQVSGADDYFLISAPNTATSGSIQIPINIPTNVASGAFDLYTCIAGTDGAVSNPISTGVGVTYPGNPGGGGGVGVVCASDDPSVGSTITCPNGRVLDFCIDQSSGNCYYEVGGTQVNCGNCGTDANAISTCVQRTAELCI